MTTAQACALAPGAGRAPGRVAFLFPGQGSQYPGMGLALSAEHAEFRAELDQCAGLLAEAGFDLAAALGADSRATELVQPATFAVEYALARTWQRLGVTPHAMIGHSLGEYVAATMAGVLAPPDAAWLVVRRAELMGAAPGGSMLAVALPEAEAAAFASEDRGIDLATVNGPRACVLAGAPEPIAGLEQELTEAGVAHSRLPVSHAFHSRTMRGCAEPLRALLAEVPLHPPRMPYVSNVTGGWITSSQATDPGYWATHLRAPVRFADGLSTLLDAAPDLLLEVGPGQVLTGLARRHPGRPAGLRQVTSMPDPRGRRSEPDGLRAALDTALAPARPRPADPDLTDTTTTDTTITDTNGS